MSKLNEDDLQTLISFFADQLAKRVDLHDSFRVSVRSLVVAEIEQAIGSTNLAKYVENLIRDEIKKHVLSKLTVDIRVSLVEPPEGVNRNVVSPEDVDPIGETRQA